MLKLLAGMGRYCRTMQASLAIASSSRRIGSRAAALRGPERAQQSRAGGGGLRLGRVALSLALHEMETRTGGA